MTFKLSNTDIESNPGVYAMRKLFYILLLFLLLYIPLYLFPAPATTATYYLPQGV